MYLAFLLSCICIGVNASIGRRLDTFEIRLDAVEMRVSTDKSLLRKMEETIETLNNSFINLEENVCLISDATKSSKDGKSPSAGTDAVKLEKYIIAGTKYEKRWLRKEVQSFRNNMDDIDKQMRSKFEQLESSVINDISRKTEELKNYEISINSTITNTEKHLNDQTHYFISELAKVKTDFLGNLRNVTEHLYSKMNETDKHIRDVLANIEIKTTQLHLNINETNEKLRKVTDDLAAVETLLTYIHWKKFGSFYYLFVEESKDFFGAKATCSIFNAYVADPESSLENDFIYSLKRGDNKNIWIGISDEEKEGVWKSVRTGNVISYTNWRRGQPNGGTEQNCACMGDEAPYELWNDYYCIYSHGFVCKRGAM